MASRAQRTRSRRAGEPRRSGIAERPPQRTRSDPSGASASPSRRFDEAAVHPGLLRTGCAVLAEVLAFSAPADAVLRRFFREHPNVGRRDRGFIAETTYAVLRKYRSLTLDHPEPTARRLFIAAAQQLPPGERRDLSSVLGEAELAWLGSLPPAGDDAALPLGIRAELPDWIVSALRVGSSDADILALGQAMQLPAPLDLRVNTLLASRAEVIAVLQDSGIEGIATPYSPLGIRVRGKPALEQHELYVSGKIEVQDEGSQLLGYLLAPRRREMVLDFCAGAGGKTLLLGAMMRSEGRLYAFDVSPQRMHRLRARLARSGLSNVQPEVISHENDARLKRLAQKIDRVLVDAPCTGFGTLRRNPDLKWRQREADLAALQEKQARILEAAARLVKPGGRLVYATCSFLPQENEQIVDAFAARHPELAEADCEAILARQDVGIACGARMHLLPQRHGTDGFFAAVFELTG